MQQPATPLDRIRDWLHSSGHKAVVLNRPQNVGWVTRGTNTPIDRRSLADPVWLVITGDTVAAVTTTIEAERIELELRIVGATDRQLITVPWYEADYRSAVADHLADLFGSDVSRESSCAADDPAEGIDVGDDLIALRMTLDPLEQSLLRQLGHQATSVLEDALANWRPGDTDFAVQADIIAGLEATGIQAPIVIVGGDARLDRFRHPVAVGAAMHERVMGVIVARQHGLHVAVTRYAQSQPESPALALRMAKVRIIESAILSALTPGSSYGHALEALAEAYEAAGHVGEWRDHYQGGPIAFDQREFEIAPTDTHSRWYSHLAEAGQAVAFNPSLAGGAKVEDTYLITADGPVLVTDSGKARAAATTARN